ncbi:hypothetical protein PMALA_061120, partial [Plasmodium malariae]
MLMLTDK